MQQIWMFFLIVDNFISIIVLMFCLEQTDSFTYSYPLRTVNMALKIEDETSSKLNF